MSDNEPSVIDVTHDSTERLKRKQQWRVNHTLAEKDGDTPKWSLTYVKSCWSRYKKREMLRVESDEVWSLSSRSSSASVVPSWVCDGRCGFCLRVEIWISETISSYSIANQFQLANLSCQPVQNEQHASYSVSGIEQAPRGAVSAGASSLSRVAEPTS